MEPELGLAAMAFKPGKTTYVTTPQIERIYILDVSSLNNCVVLEIDDEDDLLRFLDKCQPILDKYLRTKEEEREEIRKAIEKEEKIQNVSLDSMTDKQFDEFCVIYLNDNGFTNVVLLPMLIINILEILRKHSDADHRLNQKDIIDLLFSEYKMNRPPIVRIKSNDWRSFVSEYIGYTP